MSRIVNIYKNKALLWIVKQKQFIHCLLLYARKLNNEMNLSD